MHERITVRMTSEMIARIDAWIQEQPHYVSRQEAVRRCVDLMLGHGLRQHDALTTPDPGAEAIADIGLE